MNKKDYDQIKVKDNGRDDVNENNENNEINENNENNSPLNISSDKDNNRYDSGNKEINCNLSNINKNNEKEENVTQDTFDTFVDGLIKEQDNDISQVDNDIRNNNTFNSNIKDRKTSNENYNSYNLINMTTRDSEICTKQSSDYLNLRDITLIKDIHLLDKFISFDKDLKP